MRDGPKSTRESHDTGLGITFFDSKIFMHSDSHPNSCHVQVFLQQNKIYFIEKEMEQTRVKAGHIELVQGSKYT